MEINADAFIEDVVKIYKKEFLNFGFIPKKRLRKDYDSGKFFIGENGFILVGSLKSEITPIHAVYVYPEKRNGSVQGVLSLLSLLPKKKYRVRCHFGQNFWKRVGLQQIRIENTNVRKRNIYVFEGEFTRT